MKTEDFLSPEEDVIVCADGSVERRKITDAEMFLRENAWVPVRFSSVILENFACGNGFYESGNFLKECARSKESIAEIIGAKIDELCSAVLTLAAENDDLSARIVPHMESMSEVFMRLKNELNKE